MAAAVLDASLVALLGIVTVCDVRTRLIPDLPLAANLVIALAVCILWEPAVVPERLLAGLVAGGFLLAAALIRPDGMGLGDVKLAAVLGFDLGERVAEAMLVAFAAGSAAGLLLLARHGLSARGRAIPFAPFLAIGALVSLATQP